ncbi:DUF4185 domain-containing protein [Corynebacterium sp. ES2715-CONJ3]|nr:DUF4185 domain-containing protein [Corynebacterium sp. ES2715-CONJ3]
MCAATVLGQLFTAPAVTAAPCDYTRVPQEGEHFQPQGSSSLPFLSGSSLFSSSHGSSSLDQGRHPGQMPILQGATQSLHLLTGPGSPQRTHSRFGISGTDLGIAWSGPENYTYMAFGDTMSCDGADNGWRSNVLLRTVDKDYSDGLTLDEALTAGGWSSSGFAREIIGSLKVPGIEHTTIPTAGIYVNGAHYIDYMSVRRWGAPGYWDTNYAATVMSVDGVNWSLVPESIRVNADAENLPSIPGFSAYRHGNSHLQMSAFTHDDNYIYRISTKSGRDGSAYLSRAAKSEFPAENAFEYFDGSTWTDDPAVELPLLDGRVSELSVTFHEGLGRWVVLYLDENGMVLRTAEKITGPWSSKRMLISRATIPDIYGGFILPHQNSGTLEWVASTWGAYNVLVMRTKLDEISLNASVKSNHDTEDNLTVEKVVDLSPALETTRVTGLTELSLIPKSLENPRDVRGNGVE